MKHIQIEDKSLIDELTTLDYMVVCTDQAFEMEFSDDTSQDDKIKYWLSVIDSACDCTYLIESMKIKLSKLYNLDPSKIVNIDPNGFICYDE